MIYCIEALLPINGIDQWVPAEYTTNREAAERLVKIYRETDIVLDGRCQQLEEEVTLQSCKVADAL